MPDWWFYMSYAINDPIGNPLVKEFRKDLANAVRSIAGLNDQVEVKDIGCCYEGDQEPVEEWPESLKEPLLTSRAFVCLCSPSYFASEYCSKECQAFLLRWNKDEPQSAPDTPWPSVVMPVLWKPLPNDQIPVVIRDHYPHYSHSDFGSVYAEQGLYELIRLRQYKREYDQFLQGFAARLVANATYDARPGCRLLSLAEVGSAFPTQGPELKGPKVAQFVFVAGRKTELQTFRTQAEFYGEDGGYDWQPFYPQAPKWVGITVASLVEKERFYPKELALDERLIERLTEAQQKSAIVVLIVDVWTIRIDKYNTWMQQYDQATDFHNCVVLVPWNDKDDETVQNQRLLDTGLRYTFTSKASKDSASFRYPIKSLRDLELELRNALNTVRSKIQQAGELAKKAEGFIVRPQSQLPPSIGFQPR